MRKVVVATLLLFLVTPLAAHLDGRVPPKGRATVSVEAGIERQFFLYHAPLHDYISINFGYAGTRYLFHGLTVGASFQWLDAEKAAGILRLNSLYLVDRKVARFLIGGWGEANITAGNEKTGFTGGVGGQYLWATSRDMFATVNLRAGVNLVPHEKARFTIQPGVGRNFFTNDTFFFDISFAVEMFLWN